VDVESYNPNLVKVKNKLVGKVERTDLYESDEGVTRQEVDLTTHDHKLDLDLGTQAPKISTSSFLAKIKKQTEGSNDISKQIQKLGFL